jgi:hypothetical protein
MMTGSYGLIIRNAVVNTRVRKPNSIKTRNYGKID